MRRWMVNDEIWLIVREANFVNEYRIYSQGGFENSGTRSELVYSVDTVTRTCYKSAAGQVPLPCESLARDPDMRPYVLPLLEQTAGSN